ncbi:MAG: hypothetical protein CEN89_29 [Candidatus Berkelbacteria bacterium Licking1014_7]|uniref:Uncharacterized protein n=1 Tax=Candidatus Berkelbacteria bacterium Licking1014_7 TaxID=2017147 RepID=A0A554LKU7_9BACT|nr:MAG: hypothetical protein CEN89_29 [Candidatus Berkelbacteria bacterium Licking1014_7]
MPSILTGGAFLLSKIKYNENMFTDQTELDHWKKEFFREQITANTHHPLITEFNQCYKEDNNDTRLIELCAEIVDYDTSWKSKSGRIAETQIVGVMKKLSLPGVLIESAPISLDMPNGSSKVDMVMVFGSGNFWLPIQFMESRKHLSKEGRGDIIKKYRYCVEHKINPIKRYKNKPMFGGKNLPIALGNVEQNTLVNDNANAIGAEFVRSLIFSIDPSARNKILYVGPDETKKLEAYRLELLKMLADIQTAKHS